MKRITTIAALMATLALLFGVTGTVWASQRITPQKLALQTSELDSSSIVNIQGAFGPVTAVGPAAYGMVDSAGNQLVHNYLAGYELQATDSTNNAVLANYVYEFASTKEAQQEYQRWMGLLGARTGQGTATASIAGKNAGQGVRATFPSTDQVSQLNWHVSLKANFLVFLVVDAGTTTTAKGANTSAQAASYFQRLSTILIDR